MEAGSWSIGETRLELVQGDITRQDTEAIVNAANRKLEPGGGVSGAIHRAAGPSLWGECQTVNGCATGEAKITGGYHLKAKHVIHTVGPVYTGSDQDPVLLRQAYQNSLRIALAHDVKSVAFPSISTGIFGYPLEDAARTALQAVRDYLLEHPGLELVRFVLFSEPDFEVHKNAAAEVLEGYCCT